MFRSTAEVSFSELYMERSTKRNDFFKMLKTGDPLGKDREGNNKNYQKGQGTNGQPAYSGNIVIYDNSFELLVSSQ
ncbi:MAG: hypothetical protein ACMUEL_07210 [Flavobacteriales bacterium Tduv]